MGRSSVREQHQVWDSQALSRACTGHILVSSWWDSHWQIHLRLCQQLCKHVVKKAMAKKSFPKKTNCKEIMKWGRQGLPREKKDEIKLAIGWSAWSFLFSKTHQNGFHCNTLLGQPVFIKGFHFFFPVYQANKSNFCSVSVMVFTLIQRVKGFDSLSVITDELSCWDLFWSWK